MNEHLFESFRNKKVLVCGDVMVDRYLMGSVNRISPEAPVPILDYTHTENRLGGAANVSLNIAALGAIPMTCGIIGNDENGEAFIQLMQDAGLGTDLLVKSNERQTTTKTRVIANKHHLLRVDREDKHAISEKDALAVLSAVKDWLIGENVDVVILQDYNKGLLTPHIINNILNLSRERSIFTAVDPKKENFFAYKGVDLFKPNLKEVSESLGVSLSAQKRDMDKAATALEDRLQNRITLITLSENGLFIKMADHSAIVPTRKRNIVDVCGAGDTVLSIAALALSQGTDMETTGVLSNIAGGQVCERVGVVPVDLHKLIVEYTS